MRGRFGCGNRYCDCGVSHIYKNNHVGAGRVLAEVGSYCGCEPKLHVYEENVCLSVLFLRNSLTLIIIFKYIEVVLFCVHFVGTLSCTEAFYNFEL